MKSEWKKFKKRHKRNWKVNPITGCWEWQLWLTRGNYGQVTWNNKPKRAHRVTYELKYGPIPEGLFVCHKCDNPRCIRPKHLFLGTPRENTHDSMQKGRRRYGGSGNPKAKLTDELVLSILSWCKYEVDNKLIATRYKVHPTTIRLIRKGHTWKHIPRD